LIKITNQFLCSGLSFNQPKFCPSVVWNPNAVTFANVTTGVLNPSYVFIDSNNTVYVTDTSAKRVHIWLTESTLLTRNISTDSNPYSVFATMNGDIYVDNGGTDHRVDKWILNATDSVNTMNVTNTCYGLFIDIYDSIYCSLDDVNQVVKRSINDTISTLSIVAGNGTDGSAPNMLSKPRGIFVDTDLTLYVADYGNQRVQVFQYGQLNGITVVGNGSNETINLGGVMGVVLDADGYLYIADWDNSRIIGSGPNGFRCIVGCTGANGSASNQFNNVRSLSFDSYGNIFVIDRSNKRIQKFFLATNSCGKYDHIPIDHVE
jgi:hypothetical protein